MKTTGVSDIPEFGLLFFWDTLMWKVVGTKIERTQARYISLTPGRVNSRKSDFLGKTLRTQKFQWENFWGYALRIQKG